MFTGIITNLGQLKGKSGSTFTFVTQPSLITKIKRGDSIAINGVCLTIEKKIGKTIFGVSIMPETQKKTNLGSLFETMGVNLELPTTPKTFLSGHIVQGHIDTTGEITDIQLDGNSKILTIKIPTEFSHYLVNKGSVALNGISLTIIKSNKQHFTVGIIPHTWKNTTLNKVNIGDKVNIEVDILAKYLEKLLKK
ncbi:MAG: hypothetical protein ACD_72C00097G0002 [uncultured bacterium]|nr:MAG: hypothetical protein ACD_72C00097G0002 [uncultured bacterium]